MAAPRASQRSRRSRKCSAATALAALVALAGADSATAQPESSRSAIEAARGMKLPGFNTHIPPPGSACGSRSAASARALPLWRAHTADESTYAFACSLATVPLREDLLLPSPPSSAATGDWGKGICKAGVWDEAPNLVLEAGTIVPAVQCWRTPPCVRWNYATPERCKACAHAARAQRISALLPALLRTLTRVLWRRTAGLMTRTGPPRTRTCRPIRRARRAPFTHPCARQQRCWTNAEMLTCVTRAAFGQGSAGHVLARQDGARVLLIWFVASQELTQLVGAGCVCRRQHQQPHLQRRGALAALRCMTPAPRSVPGCSALPARNVSDVLDSLQLCEASKHFDLMASGMHPGGAVSGDPSDLHTRCAACLMD